MIRGYVAFSDTIIASTSRFSKLKLLFIRKDVCITRLIYLLFLSKAVPIGQGSFLTVLLQVEVVLIRFLSLFFRFVGFPVSVIKVEVDLLGLL